MTCGEGKYEIGIKIMVTLARKHLKIDLPIRVFHNGPWSTSMKGLDVEMIDSRAMQASHPAKTYGGWQAKDFAVIHSGFERALFLDADAYCVADPAPLFDLLDQHRFIYCGTGGPGNGCGPIPNELPMHHNGGQYLVNLRTFWSELHAMRWLSNHGYSSWAATSKAFRRHGLGDECVTRLVRSVIEDRGCFMADSSRYYRGLGMTFGHAGQTYVVHRMRPASKLFPNSVPRGHRSWPLESLVMRLFAMESPEYAAKLEAERIARLPVSKRARRRAAVNNMRRR